ncbi:putative transcription factor SOX-14 [Amphibalanus amphitrite]|uniref:Putative transcription factor SOX-14 n=1 Tax=Amphibalanus amphitrite TaxID=1232801 RepID=A0A6A4W568_AMPAM|nr:putative transcription factor SOX-14 [Amphibalanus amphitrite]
MCANAMAINLNQFQIRYPDFPKYLWESPTPYSDAMNIKKSRRNPEHTKRPLNTFMLFAKIQREYITANFSCNHSEISKALGRLWQDLSKDEKEPFIRGAKTLVELHRLEYPDYKYRPRKKGQPKETVAKTTASPAAKKNSSRQERKPVVAASYMSPASPPGLTADPRYLGGGGSPLSAVAAPDSPLSSCYGGVSPLSPAGSSHCQASPASVLHTPYSPVPSIGSSSGYESEMSSGVAAHELSAGAAEEAAFYDMSPAGHCPFSPEPEADMDLELRELDVQPLDEESSLLNPLAMFPVLDLCSDDLDDLAFAL